MPKFIINNVQIKPQIERTFETTTNQLDDLTDKLANE